MASYRLLLKRVAVKELESLPLKDRKRIVAKIQHLASQSRPAGGEMLSGEEKYRLRQGDCRVLYTVDDEAATVVVVGSPRQVS